MHHHIPTVRPSVWSCPRRLSPEKLRAARCEFDSLLQMGIFHPSSNQWASPMHLIPKALGEWCPCGDYHRLNLSSMPDRYPIPHIQDFYASLAGCVFFSKVSFGGITNSRHPVTSHYHPLQTHAIWPQKRSPDLPMPNEFCCSWP